MTWTRRHFLTFTGALGAATLIGAGAGCAEVADPVAFTALDVTESGGVDGRRNVLSVQTDGTAVLLGRQVAAGQLPAADLARLRTLLESEQFRREATAEPGKPSKYSCTDMVYLTVTMGPLSVSRSGTCGGDREKPAPAYGEIVSLLSQPRRGIFPDPVGNLEPRLQPLTLERTETGNAGGYRIAVRADGSGSVRRTGGQVDRRLDRPAADALRLLQARLLAAAPQPCAPRGAYQLSVGGTAVCGSLTGLEFRSIIVLLEDVFSL
ncbi:MAG TPA: twin-arginine translocation signal domain-containing protein [Propionibacteriaceae bacterium]